jgi:hypothetical protein
MDHSGRNDLLILYYMDYDVYRKDRANFEPQPNPEIMDKDVRVNWNNVEKNLNYSKGDVLTILDTCYSGPSVKTTTPALDTVKAEEKVYEALCPSSIYTTTATPNQYSFTRALLNALTELADEHGDTPFTTFDLNERILLDPRRKDHPSQLVFRSRNHGRHIRLAPLMVFKDNDQKVQTATRASPNVWVKDLEKDSGYASASRPATVSDTHIMDLELQDSGNVNDEIGSVLSDNEDIGSQASYGTTNEEMTGKALIRLFLVKQPQFKALCEEGLAKMNSGRFVDNLRRLLKLFHMHLSAEAESEAEKAVAGLLRSNRGRLRISQQVAFHVRQDQEEEVERPTIDLQVAPADKHSVETWLSRTAERGMKPLQEEDQEAAYYSASSDSEADLEGDEEFPYITELEGFLRGARSYEILLRDFMLMFLPTGLRHMLLSIPKRNIHLSREQSSSTVRIHLQSILSHDPIRHFFPNP